MLVLLCFFKIMSVCRLLQTGLVSETNNMKYRNLLFFKKNFQERIQIFARNDFNKQKIGSKRD